MNDLNLFYLKCFLDAVLMGSISEAARRNFVSQSAVSQAIRKLEDVLKIKLSSHKKHTFEPTEEGKIVFKQAEAIFSSVRSLFDALGAFEKSPRTPIYFVTTHSIGLSLLPPFLSHLRKAFPQMEIHFQFGGLSQIKGWLKQGIFEFALVLDGPYLDEYQKLPLLEGKFGLFKHKSTKKNANELGIFVEHTEGFLVPEFLHQNPLPIAAELSSWELIARTLEEQQGYGLLPDFVFSNNRYPHLTPVPTPTLPYTLQAITHKGKKLSYSAQTFLQEFHLAYKPEII